MRAAHANSQRICRHIHISTASDNPINHFGVCNFDDCLDQYNDDIDDVDENNIDIGFYVDSVFRSNIYYFGDGLANKIDL